MTERITVSTPASFDRMWSGTTAADNTNPVVGNVSHHELLGLDRKWIICGWEFFVSQGGTGITAYAVDSERWEIGNRDDLRRVCEQRGSVPVVAHNVTWEGTLEDFLMWAFNPITVQLLSTGTTSGLPFDLLDSVEITAPHRTLG